MRLHAGKPRERLTLRLGYATFLNGNEMPKKETRQIDQMWGISWKTKTGFKFIGYQRVKKYRT